MKRNLNFKSQRAQRRINRILEVLKDGPMLARTIADAVHCHRSMVTDYLTHLMDEPRRVRIADYWIIGKRKAPCYGLGSDPNEESTPMTHAERWAAVKADPVRYAAALESRKRAHKKKREKMGPKLRDRRVYVPPLPEQVLSLLLEVPGYTTPQMAIKLDANERAVRTAVSQLKKGGKIRRAQNSTMKEYQWETLEKPMPAPLAKTMKPQTIFSALGL